MSDWQGNESDEQRAAREAAERGSQRAPDEQPQVQHAAGYAALNAGDHCPLCNVGVLYTISEADDAITLRCFNCNRQGSHRPSLGYQVHTTGPAQTPTGFTLSQAQHAAKNADDPEQAANAAAIHEQGSGIASPPVGGQSG